MELRRQRNRLHELELRVLVQADRDDVGADSGAVSTPAWLAHATRTSTAGCHRELHLAAKLDSRFGQTRAALAAGVIDVEKAGIVTDAVERLTAEYDGLAPGTEVRARCTCSSRPWCSTPRRSGSWASGCSRWSAPRRPTPSRARGWSGKRPGPWALAHLSLHDNGDGTSDGRFRLPTLHAQLLKKALEALTSPRRLGEGRIDPETGTKLPHNTLLGHGLMELLENHLTALPSQNGSPFTLVVTIGLDARRPASA